MGLVEMIYAFLLGTVLVGFHRLSQRYIFKTRQTTILALVLVWGLGVLIAFLFTRLYFTAVLGISIQPSFEFDIAVLSLVLPLILSGVGDRVFLEYQSQAFALQAEKQKKQAIAARFEVLKMRLSPHFLFNSLNTLSDIIEEEPDLALRFVQHMATTYRYILEHRDKSAVSLAVELQSIQALLFILTVRHGAALEVDETVTLSPVSQEMIAPLTLQELVENALKHNQYSAEKPLTIKICRQQQTIVVENNRRKRVSDCSNNSGLENLQGRIAHAFSRPLVIEEDQHAFRVSVPLQPFPYTG